MAKWTLRHMAVDEIRGIGEVRGCYSQMLGLLRILAFVLIENVYQEE